MQAEDVGNGANVETRRLGQKKAAGLMGKSEEQGWGVGGRTELKAQNVLQSS